MAENKDKQFLKTFVTWLSIIVSIKLIILCFVFFRFAEKSNEYKGVITQNPQFCFNEQCINLEIAQSDEERELGLMFRENLEEDKGMLFLFPKEDYHGMWMRNTLIPLDIIWINKENTVVDIVSASPCEEENCDVYKPEELNSFAIEINSGGAASLGLYAGNQIELIGIE